MKYSFSASISAAFLLSTFVLGGLAHAKRGGMDSGGGDYHDAHYGSAWFLGEAPIPTCFEVSADLGVEPKDDFPNWSESIAEGSAMPLFYGAYINE